MLDEEKSVRSSDTYSDDGVKRTAGGVKLEPQPTDDPRDPLNWSTWRKVSTLAVVSFASFNGISQALANQSGIVVQGNVYHKEPTEMAYSISAAVAGLGTGPILWTALSLYVGRTSVIFWALVCNVGVNIWSSLMTNEAQYAPFVVSRWLGGTFGSAPTTLGVGIIIDTFFLHQRGKAFICFYFATLFGTQFGSTSSGFVVSSAPWPAQFWWTIGALGLTAITVFFFLGDTTYLRDKLLHKNLPVDGYVSDRIATFFPGHRIVHTDKNRHGPFDSILIGIQPVTILAGLCLLICFGWVVAVFTTYSVFLQTPMAEGGYGFTPLQNAYFSFSGWLAMLAAEVLGLSLNDRVPLSMCRRHGNGVWKAEYRLYPLIMPPLVLVPLSLGIIGAALQYHLHYMVLALGVFLLQFAESFMVPIVNNYVAECFIDHAQEVSAALNFYRTILGLTVTFFIDPWKADVGFGWAFGVMALFSVLGFTCVLVLTWKGKYIRTWSMKRFRVSEDGDALFKKD